ncbi:universal stress protein [Streptomyces sp. NPDC090109]|uniref:universal stress protein n=1 Tax=Streptomyces sp. NPDC090109 TaxID=3365948 RepID=UPI0037F86B9F
MTTGVIVGLNGLEESFTAVRRAAGETVLRQVPLRLVHVEGWPDTPAVPLACSRFLDERTEVLLRNESDRVRREHPDLEVSVERTRGQAADELTAAAHEAAHV